MSVDIKVPTLGESVVEAGILRWLKKEGDAVAEGEAVVELETDKINVEVFAEKGGVLESIARQEGDTVGVSEVLGRIATNGAAPATTPEAPAVPKVEPPVAQASPVVANGATTNSKPLVETIPQQLATSNSQPIVNPAARATPVAVKMADDAGLDLAAVKGTGTGGKITIEDVRAALSARTASPAPTSIPVVEDRPPAVTVETPAAPIISARAADPREEVRPMTRRRQAIARNLVEAQHTAAMLTTFNEVDMSAVMELRKRRNPDFEKRNGVKVGFMSFFTKAVVGALKAFPLLNAEIRGTDIVVKRYYDIGIAVSTDDGLVVPILRDADALTFAGIEKGIGELATKARGGGLKLEDMQGGTFTITNGGIFGSLMSTPILNPPQVGILGMHKIQERPMVVNGEIVVRPMMYLALSYDHRIVDGAEAVRFLVRVKELIEDPESLLLEG